MQRHLAPSMYAPALSWQSRTLDYPFHPAPCSPEGLYCSPSTPFFLTEVSIVVPGLSYQTAPRGNRQRVAGRCGVISAEAVSRQTITVKHRKYGFLARAKPSRTIFFGAFGDTRLQRVASDFSETKRRFWFKTCRS